MADIDKAKELVRQQLDKGTPPDKIREVLWNAGYTQVEISSIMSADAPPKQSLIKYSQGSAMAGGQASQPGGLVDAQPPHEEPQTGSKLAVIGLAALVVIVVTLMPFAIPRPGAGGEKMDLADVQAYKALLEQKIEQAGGMKCDIVITARASGNAVIMAGIFYQAPGKIYRVEGTVSSDSFYGKTNSPLLIISDGASSYTRYEGSYLNEPYWEKNEEDPMDTEGSLPNVDYYNQGYVDCGEGDTCRKIYASEGGAKVTVLMRDDGVAKSVVAESADEYLEITQKNAVFGPLDSSLFELPANETVREGRGLLF